MSAPNVGGEQTSRRRLTFCVAKCSVILFPHRIIGIIKVQDKFIRSIKTKA